MPCLANALFGQCPVWPMPNPQFPIPNSQLNKKNRLAIFHSAYLNHNFNGSPQRRLTSAFDLVFYQVGTVARA